MSVKSSPTAPSGAYDLSGFIRQGWFSAGEGSGEEVEGAVEAREVRTGSPSAGCDDGGIPVATPVEGSGTLV